MSKSKVSKKLKIGILIPHIFAQDKLSEEVIFAPLPLAINLANTLSQDHDVYLFSPGKITTKAKNITCDLSLIEKEVERESLNLQEFVIENPLAFTSLSRQVHAEITAKAFQYAKDGEIDILHIFMCEDEIPLYFSNLVNVPIVYTHHDPFNFYRRYRARFPNLKNLNYVSISDTQRLTAPKGLNFIKTVYNGIEIDKFPFNNNPRDYFAFMGRIVRVKGCHNAIQACIENKSNLKIVGKHYANSDDTDNSYWEKYISPQLDNEFIDYKGFIKKDSELRQFISNAKALLFPIEWDEPFGMVIIEALATGTPVIAYPNGAVTEIIEDGKNGFLVNNVNEMKKAMKNINKIDRRYCRESIENRFTVKKMAEGYLDAYKKLFKKSTL
jgi:glycosyltransferase involved in cell wall biosynthesis